jgi:hypothetical protein
MPTSTTKSQLRLIRPQAAEEEGEEEGGVGRTVHLKRKGEGVDSEPSVMEYCS